MPRARDSQFPVITHLKELAQEADQYTADFPPESAVDAWFDCVKETFIKIRDCTELKEFDYPPSSDSIFGENRTNRNVNKVSENQIAHIHANKHPATSEENKTVDEVEHKTVVNSKDPHSSSLECKNEIKAAPYEDEVDQKNSQLSIPSNNTALQAKTPCSPEIKAPCFPKAKTPSTLKMKTPYTPKAKILCTPKVALLPLKTSLLQNCISNSSEKLQTPIMDRTFVRSINASTVLLSSQSSNGTNSSKGVDSFSTIKTRSSSKRKSSISKEGSNKRQKTKVSKDIPVGRRVYPDRLIEKTASVKVVTILGSENKAKVPAVVVPTVLIKKTPVPSKEIQILQEIKKKDEKASENRKRVLEERKMKAEENKKKREEKMEKTAQKRLKMEKEKREMETKKSQVLKEPTKNSAMKTRVKELINQSIKESKSSKSGPLTSKQNEMNGEIYKTPASKKSFDSENYELTPIPDSSTYDFSEGEDDRPTGKPIPLWAQGVHIKSALIQQFYNPPDVDEIFGCTVDSVDLVEIFNVQKKRYKVRTSSAVWNTPPDRSLRH